MTGLPAHLESFLGEISVGASGDDSTPDGVQVVWFAADSPYAGVVTVATLGLSNYHLGQPSGKGLHQELLMHLPLYGQPSNAAGVLFQVGQYILDRGHGLLRGEVVGPWGRLFANSQMTALYAASPVYLPDEFAICRVHDRTIVLTWLVPITDSEAHYVAAHGWRAFEDALLAEDPDLCDLSRDSLTASLVEKAE